MSRKIKKVGILGAGTMGSQIAAHLANVGIPSVLLDMPKQGEGKNKLTQLALKRLTKMKPAPLFSQRLLRLIQPGNLEDDMCLLRDCDWVIEAVVENLNVKQDLWERVEPKLKEGAIVSSNTSGLSIGEISAGRSTNFRSHWLGTHFFNPPRYMKLLEIIPGPDTLPEVVKFFSVFGERVLGKGIVFAKDRPNFVANRIGAFALSLAMHLTEKKGLSITDVDSLTGPLIGRPKTATFRLADLIGNDVVCHVSENLYDSLPYDSWREYLAPTDFMRTLLKRGWNGLKSGQGYYLKKNGEYLVLNLERMKYESQKPVQIPSLAYVIKMPDVLDRIRYLIHSEDASKDFLWPLLRDTLAYSAGLVGEICDHLYQIDQAMRWGWGWSHGPFEIWEGLGALKTTERIQKDGIKLPDWVLDAMSLQGGSFYAESYPPSFFDQHLSIHQEIPLDSENLNIEFLKSQNHPVLSNESASLIDLGEGVACLEFHSKMNTLDKNLIDLAFESTKLVATDFRALVIGNQGLNFSVGANLERLLDSCRKRSWQEIDARINRFQKLCNGLRNAPFPVVAVPFGQTLAGGMEICLHCDNLVTSAELYMGLVEVGVGLVPAGGGCRQILLRNQPSNTFDKQRQHAAVLKVFREIGTAKVSGSALEAKEINFLRERDKIEIREDRLLFRAKQTAIGLSVDYSPPCLLPLVACGTPGLANLELEIHLMRRSGYLSDHDVLIMNKLASVLCGGNLTQVTVFGEEYFSGLEKEAFLSLCGEQKTQQRIQHMLETGKALKN